MKHATNRDTKLIDQAILVTGGTGFIGQHLASRLIETGLKTRVLSRSVKPKVQKHSLLEYVTGDFTDPAVVENVLDGVDSVYHLAATTKPGNANDRIQFDAESNLLGSLRLAEAAARANIQRFIFVSSGGSIYGANATAPAHEDMPLHPISAHAVSKLAIEKYLEVIRRQYGMEYRIARGGNPYGEGQLPLTGQGFIASALYHMAAGQPMTIWGDGTVVRDFFHVSDFTRALVRMLDDTGPHRVYNIASGRGISLNEIVSLLEQATGLEALVEYLPGRQVDVPYSCLDISRATEYLGWYPEIDLPQGLAQTWAWLRNWVDFSLPCNP